jgi:hypothetical protein
MQIRGVTEVTLEVASTLLIPTGVYEVNGRTDISAVTSKAHRREQLNLVAAKPHFTSICTRNTITYGGYVTNLTVLIRIYILGVCR